MKNGEKPFSWYCILKRSDREIYHFLITRSLSWYNLSQVGFPTQQLVLCRRNFPHLLRNTILLHEKLLINAEFYRAKLRMLLHIYPNGNQGMGKKGGLDFKRRGVRSAILLLRDDLKHTELVYQNIR